MDKPAKIVRDCYNHLASAYDEWAKSVRIEERQKYLAKTNQTFLNGSRILDIGCGNGLLTTRQLANRFDVIGIDISERQIVEAQRNLPNVEFICTDIRNYELEEDSLDGIVSFYCFNHIPRISFSALLEKFNRWLKAGGQLIASFGIGDTEEWIGEWLGTTTFFSSFGRKETISLIRNNGFEIEEETVETAFENVADISFLWVRARKSSNKANSTDTKQRRS